MEKLIKNFINDEAQQNIELACKDCIIYLEKEGANIVINYKDNEMLEAGFGLMINFEDVKQTVVVKTIMAFIKA